MTVCDKIPAADTSSLSVSRDNRSRAGSPIRSSKEEYKDLHREQEKVPLKFDDPPRFPEMIDFSLPAPVSMSIIDPIVDVAVKNCVILLPNDGNDEATLSILARRLQQEEKESAFIMLRDIHAVRSGNSGYHFVESEGAPVAGLSAMVRTVLVNTVKNGLVENCHFPPRSIIVVGHMVGGTAALAAATVWNKVELGGIVSVGGPMSTDNQLAQNVKTVTPALILGGILGNFNASALQSIQDTFTHFNSELRPGADDKVPGLGELKPLLDFIAHRLRREEWTKQAVLSLGKGCRRSNYVSLTSVEGGGIRGYGSLLILRELMNRIGDEEKRLGHTESSFAPYDYKPTSENPTIGDDESMSARSLTPFKPFNPANLSGSTDRSTSGLHRPQHTVDPDHSRFFLPCHYFTYAAGTSTGGYVRVSNLR